MDVKFWLTVIIAVVWFLVQAMRKNAQNKDVRPPEPDHEDTGNKPMTFEELLREIQQAKTPPKPIAKEPEIQTRPTYQTVPPTKSYEIDYDDDIKDEEQDLETIPQRDNRSSEIYENAKRDAFNRPSLEETMKLEDTDVKFGHFKVYDDVPKKSVASDILKDFSDPEGFKKAFIMSEILKRKF